ncbi:lipid-A-disaccharide synthase [Luteolibacter algae]|uniref:Lipid-A-disaccharide synthase n=1 Tax=Luteolibacter algae TaxID=454151 RepID=A0ABW5D6N6_9BACT
MKRIYVVAGEMSGDAHAAGLLRELSTMHADLEIFGAGGPEMYEVSGGKINNWVEDAAVMGVIEVLKRYGWFKEQFEKMMTEIKTVQPDVLLLVDYPGFNLRFAKSVKEALPQVRQVYYISPQVWAWNKKRIPKMVELLDEMLCLFPFEQPIFQDAGLKTTHVGHPLVDELAQERCEGKRIENLIGLFPGSREREIAKLFPMMIETAARLRTWRHDLVFSVPAATPKLAITMRKMIAEANASDWITLTNGGSHKLMQTAACGIIASGTATLEAATFGLPYCLVYKMAWTTYFLGRMLVKIKYIGLVNILAGEKVVEEFIQADACAQEVGDWVRDLLSNDQKREELMKRLSEVSEKLGDPGTHRRAAERVSDWLNR